MRKSKYRRSTTLWSNLENIKKQKLDLISTILSTSENMNSQSPSLKTQWSFGTLENLEKYSKIHYFWVFSYNFVTTPIKSKILAFPESVHMSWPGTWWGNSKTLVTLSDHIISGLVGQGGLLGLVPVVFEILVIFTSSQCCKCFLSNWTLSKAQNKW